MKYNLYQGGKYVGSSNAPKYVHAIDNVNKKYEYYVAAVDKDGVEGFASAKIATLGVSPAPAATTAPAAPAAPAPTTPAASAVSEEPAVEETAPVEEPVVLEEPTILQGPVEPVVTTDDNLGEATQASAFSAFGDLLRSWMFWLGLLLIVLAGLLWWLFFYKRDTGRDEDAQEGATNMLGNATPPTPPTSSV